MARARLTELDLSYHAQGLPDRDTYLTVASTCLSDALPGDIISWAGVDPAKPTVIKMWHNEPEMYRIHDVFSAVIAEHPFMVHWQAHPDSEPVLRLSDCISDREFRSSRVYHELYVPVGSRYELAIMTAPDNPPTSGWGIRRSTQDFTEADLWYTCRLQPMLAVLDAVYPPFRIRQADRTHTDEARTRVGLTVRELDILTLLADGLSAQQIALLRRISVRTVRKHLENIYDKLDCHDRLLAVNKARQLGLLDS
ncbi:MAG: response regulator transcription factor [Pseudonocardiales bacterium]|nr:response regulator transcription factor [Pseudonocardiales bacterium]